MKHLSSITLVLAAAIAFTPAALAQQNQPVTDPTDRSATDDARMQRIAGAISETYPVQLIGQEEKHLLARIEQQEGGLAHVDLGPTSKLASLNLSEGDNVTVVGVPGRINDRPVFIASRVQAKQDVVEIDRARFEPLTKIDGEIEGLRRVRYTDAGQDHVVSRVRLDNGTLLLVDLGAATALDDAQLAIGSPVSVIARQGTINNRRAYFAIAARVSEERVAIDRKHTEMNMEVASESRYEPVENVDFRAEATPREDLNEPESDESSE